MTKQLTKYFGEIDLDSLQEWYDSEIEINGKIVEISIAISSALTGVDEISLQAIDHYIDNLNTNESDIRHTIEKDFHEDGEVADYIEQQIKHQDKEKIANLICYIDKKITKKEKLLSVLDLLWIRFYPERDDTMFAVFDYTICEELTDDLIAVKILKNKSILIDIEN
jgi:Protein of unknown function (DUF2004)